MAHQQISRPRQRRRRRLVAGQEQRDELVAQLLVAHRAAVLEARARQQRQDVLALGEGRVDAPLRDLGEQHVVDLASQLAQLRERIETLAPA